MRNSIEWPRVSHVVVAERLAGRDAQLLADQVDAADLLGDRVLDLQARVDLEERDRAVGGDEELARPGADVAGLAQDRLRRLDQLRVLRVGEERRGRLLDQLLVAALQRAVARGDDDDRAVLRPPGTASRRAAGGRGTARRSTRRARTPRRPRGWRTRTSRRSRSTSRATFRPRPPPPNAALMATGRPCSATNAWISSTPCTGSGVPATRGAPARCAMCRALTLSPSDSIAAGGGPIQTSPASMTACANAGVLGEEAVAGVHGVGAGAPRDVEQLGDVEVRLGRAGAVRARTPRRRRARAAASRSVSA